MQVLLVKKKKNWNGCQETKNIFNDVYLIMIFSSFATYLHVYTSEN